MEESDKLDAGKKLRLLTSLLNKIEKDIIYYEKVDATKRSRQDQVITLAQFIRANDYYFEFNATEFFLIQARILTIYKKQYLGSNPEIAYDTLSKDLGVSKNMARRLVHIYQINLSKISCDFILNLFDLRSELPMDRDYYVLYSKLTMMADLFCLVTG